MTRRKLILLAAGASMALAAPAQAQHHGHNMPGMTMPMPKKAPPKKPAPKKAVPKKAAPKMVAPAKKAAEKKAAVKKAPVKKAAPAKKRASAKARPAAVDPHAGHDMSAMPAAAVPAVDPHAGHDMTATPAPSTPATDPHAGHDMANMPSAAAAGTDLPAGNASPPPVPTDSAADTVYGHENMHMGRHHLVTMHGGQKYSRVMLNIAEYQVRRGRDGYEWDGEASYGGDINRVSLKSEGEGEIGGRIEKAEVQALYSRAIGPYFNLQGGVRYDIRPNPSRVYAAIGVEGLAPSFFDVEGTLFLSNKGELLARAEGYYDQRITQRLILQPRAEINFAAQNTRETLTGAGLSDAELGLRLRYDIKREFAPYVGVQYRRAFGKTRDYLRDAGEDAGGFSLLAGIRMWF
ncbi:MAG: copper resistance protein B [Pseudomonadota bacterium]|nr:copper resistance protein B [Pseudomonadota bacterium]